jgi:hypothetical protein
LKDPDVKFAVVTLGKEGLYAELLLGDKIAILGGTISNVTELENGFPYDAFGVAKPAERVVYEQTFMPVLAISDEY